MRRETAIEIYNLKGVSPQFSLKIDTWATKLFLLSKKQ